MWASQVCRFTLFIKLETLLAIIPSSVYSASPLWGSKHTRRSLAAAPRLGGAPFVAQRGLCSPCFFLEFLIPVSSSSLIFLLQSSAGCSSHPAHVPGQACSLHLHSSELGPSSTLHVSVELFTWNRLLMTVLTSPSGHSTVCDSPGEVLGGWLLSPRDGPCFPPSSRARSLPLVAVRAQ